MTLDEVYESLEVTAASHQLAEELFDRFLEMLREENGKEEEAQASFFAVPKLAITRGSFDALVEALRKDSGLREMFFALVQDKRPDHARFWKRFLRLVMGFNLMDDALSSMRRVDTADFTLAERHAHAAQIATMNRDMARALADWDTLDLAQRVDEATGLPQANFISILLIGYILRRAPRLWLQFRAALNVNAK